MSVDTEQMSRGSEM